MSPSCPKLHADRPRRVPSGCRIDSAAARRAVVLVLAGLLACACGGEGGKPEVQMTAIRGVVCESRDGAPAFVTGEASYPRIRECRHPVVGARIAVVMAGGGATVAVTGKNGWFSLEGVRLAGAGDERIEFTADHHKSLTLDRIGPGRKVLDEPRNYVFVALPRS